MFNQPIKTFIEKNMQRGHKRIVITTTTSLLVKNKMFGSKTVRQWEAGFTVNLLFFLLLLLSFITIIKKQKNLVL